MGTHTVITTRRLRLRTWHHGDWKAFNKHCNTAAVMEWFGGTVTPRQVQREVDWYMRHQARQGITFWVVERKRDKAFLGFCGLIRVGELASPIRGHIEIGWRIRDDMWRRGYAYEASKAVMNWAENELLGEQVFARINPKNIASIALAKRIGMRTVIDGRHIHPADGMRLDVFSFQLGRKPT